MEKIKAFWKKNKKKILIGGGVVGTILMVALGVKRSQDYVGDGTVYEAETPEELPVFQTEAAEEMAEVPAPEE